MSLPTELIDYVSDNLSFKELTVLAMVNSDLCSIAQRHLYRDVQLSGPTLPVVQTLASKPHLAHNVRSFRLVVGPYALFAEAYYDSLATAISHMPLLVSLRLSLSPTADPSIVLPTDTSFPWLQTFYSTLPFSAPVLSFLGQTPNLLNLSLGRDTWGAPSHEIVSKLIIPQLQEFHGPVRAARAIVPGRPVHSIVLTSADLSTEVVRDIAKSSVPVLRLDLMAASSPTAILQAVAAEMPELRKLRVLTVHNLWDQFFTPEYLLKLKKIMETMNHLMAANISELIWKWHVVDGRRVVMHEPQVVYVRAADEAEVTANQAAGLDEMARSGWSANCHA